MKRTIIAALFALVAVSAFGQTDSTKVKKEKENRIGLNGTVADSFTKAAIPDVKVTLLRDDSTVVGTMRAQDSRLPQRTTISLLADSLPNIS